MLLEVSLATANLAHAAGGNALPLLSAQTGFLALDGSSSQVVNRSPRPWMNIPFQRPPHWPRDPADIPGGSTVALELFWCIAPARTEDLARAVVF